jgi:hypothetical protein
MFCVSTHSTDIDHVCGSIGMLGCLAITQRLLLGERNQPVLVGEEFEVPNSLDGLVGAVTDRAVRRRYPTVGRAVCRQPLGQDSYITRGETSR